MPNGRSCLGAWGRCEAKPAYSDKRALVLRIGVLSIVTKASAAPFVHGGAGRRHKTAQPAMQKANVLLRIEGLWFGLPPCYFGRGAASWTGAHAAGTL